MREGSSYGSFLSRTQIQRRPKASQVQVNAITERLYDSSKIRKKTKIDTPVKEESVYRESSAEKKSKSSLRRMKSCQNSFISSHSSSRPSGEVYDRLYNNSKSKQLRKKYNLDQCAKQMQPNIPKNTSPHNKRSKKSLYLTNYTPFYERLDQ